MKQRDTSWFQQYLQQLEKFGFKPNLADTSEDGFVTSFNSVTVSAQDVKNYFKAQGFSNLEKRSYMAHTGHPHINLDKAGHTVQISWYTKGQLIGISFLGGAL